MKRSALCLLAATFVCQFLCVAEDRIWMDVIIHGQPVHLAFDTGADVPLLFRSAAERLKFKLLESPFKGQATSGLATNSVTELADFRCGTVSGQIQFLVVDLPAGSHTLMDGCISWNPFRTNVVILGPGKGMQIGTAVPAHAETWPKFKQVTDCPKLAFDVGGADPEHRIVLVDTGDAGGVVLTHVLYAKWAATRHDQPRSISHVASLMTSSIIKEELWADQIAIGSLVLTNVPVRECGPKEDFDVSNHAATLGLYALRRLDFVLDGQNGVVYARPKGDVPPIYPHNHLGAAFDTIDDAHDDLLAHVASGSPAFQAGIRDGDVLLKVDDLDMTKWRTDPEIAQHHFWDAPPRNQLPTRLETRRPHHSDEGHFAADPGMSRPETRTDPTGRSPC